MDTEELRLGADVHTVAAATADAAEPSTAPRATRRSFTPLAPDANPARGTRPRRSLGSSAAPGIQVPDRPTLMDVAAAYSEAVDRHVHRGGRTDLGEMAQMAAVESLGAVSRTL